MKKKEREGVDGWKEERKEMGLGGVREERKRNFSAEERFRQKYKGGCFKAEREATVHQ